MGFIQMIKSAMPRGKTADERTIHHLSTVFGESINPEHVLSEYPRPQMERESYVNLNGYWEYAVNENPVALPESYAGRILVPFSPETDLSGVKRQLQPGEVLWYRRFLPINRRPGHLLLHFGAVDERCRIILNGVQVCEHRGGYLPFEADITPYIREGENELIVRVLDDSDTSYHARGKQRLKSGGIFYTAQSGIWQTVWMEWVPELYIKNLRITPDIDNEELRIQVELNRQDLIEGYEDEKGNRQTGSEKQRGTISEAPEVEVQIEGLTLTCRSLDFVVPIKNPKLWSPERPYLYVFTLQIGQDKVTSYAAMRKFSVETVSGQKIPRLCLNGRPYFLNGVLDQGYYPESLLTPPSEEAMEHDIKVMKNLGFNMLRKHCKIEPLRWYYLCDRLGMVVWQDIINGGSEYDMNIVCYLPTVFPFAQKMKEPVKAAGRLDAGGKAEWREQCRETLELLYNCPCIGSYTVFNEGWGQFETEENEKLVRACAGDRPIDMASGWFDRGGGDIYSTHDYFRKLKVRHNGSSRAYVISEYGGLTYMVKGHTYCEDKYGYQSFESREKLSETFFSCQVKIRELVNQGLSAAVYTQLSDIEEEVNGIMTYDRKMLKAGEEPTVKKSEIRLEN